MTNDMNPLAMPQEIQEMMVNQFHHALTAFGDTVVTLHDAGTEPPALASALAAAYARYVATLMAMNKMPVDQVMEACKSGIDTMQDFINEIHEQTTKVLAEKDAA